MISGCKGCEEEWSVAGELVEEGGALVQQEITHIGERKHFIVFMVNENDGHIMVR